MTELPPNIANKLIEAAGMTTREAAANLIMATRCLTALDIQCTWLTETAYLLADLAHELEPTGLRLNDNPTWRTAKHNPGNPAT